MLNYEDFKIFTLSPADSLICMASLTTRKLKSSVVPMHNTFQRNERKTFVGKNINIMRFLLQDPQAFQAKSH